MFVIAKANQTVLFGSLTNRQYGDPPVALTATASSGLLVSFSATGNCTVAGTLLTITGAGSCAVRASQAGDANYTVAPDVTQTFAISKADQTIAFGPLPHKRFGAPPFTISASASSGLPISFSATGECTIAGATVTISGPGECRIRATQAGNANYNPAPDVVQTLQAQRTISIPLLTR